MYFFFVTYCLFRNTFPVWKGSNTFQDGLELFQCDSSLNKESGLFIIGYQIQKMCKKGGKLTTVRIANHFSIKLLIIRLKSQSFFQIQQFNTSTTGWRTPWFQHGSRTTSTKAPGRTCSPGTPQGPPCPRLSLFLMKGCVSKGRKNLRLTFVFKKDIALRPQGRRGRMERKISGAKIQTHQNFISIAAAAKERFKLTIWARVHT